jgi:parvulin-like peptidyl-prolyl isomerase
MKKIIFTALAAMCAAALFGAGQADKIIVKVNDEIILQSEVDEAAEMAEAQAKLSNQPFNEDEFRKTAVKNMVEQKLIITMAKDESVVVSDEAVADKVNEFLEGLRAKFQTEEAFEEALQKEGLSYTDFRIKIEAQVHDSLIFSKVKQKKQQDFIAKAAVNEDELKDYYDKNKDSLKVDDQMSLTKIYIARGQIEAADLDKYTAEIAAKIKAEGFEKTAQELKGKKGVTISDLGWVETADMSKNVRDALKDPKKGKVTDPIDTPSSSPADNGGYQIIKITDYKSGKVPEYADVKDKVRVKVIEEKVDALWNEWIDTVKKKAYINYM